MQFSTLLIASLSLLSSSATAAQNRGYNNGRSVQRANTVVPGQSHRAFLARQRKRAIASAKKGIKAAPPKGVTKPPAPKSGPKAAPPKKGAKPPPPKSGPKAAPPKQGAKPPPPKSGPKGAPPKKGTKPQKPKGSSPIKTLQKGSRKTGKSGDNTCFTLDGSSGVCDSKYGVWVDCMTDFPCRADGNRCTPMLAANAAMCS
ncbi:unnamed protein product [Clonostachys rosea]|uniref:Extracellular membrane protein CFEM domain-containing protein n=1 Tax=Bionectria ochroleuca TaxID=29856 RepID=A0ABY6TZT2_BIOOC|nr:unnamed protein product [Clonostachys rosea]